MSEFYALAEPRAYKLMPTAMHHAMLRYSANSIRLARSAPVGRKDKVRRATRAVAGRPPAMRSPGLSRATRENRLRSCPVTFRLEAHERSRRGLARRKPERPLRFRTRAPNPLPQATRAGRRRARAARTIGPPGWAHNIFGSFGK